MATERSGGLELQERDFDILLGLFECRIMSLRHVCDLFFDGKTEAGKKRIQKLKAAGFVRERPRRIGDPSVLQLTTKAFTALQRSGRLDSFPQIGLAAMEKRAQVSDLTIRHELEVMDVRTAFFSALRASPNLKIAEFSTWPVLYQFTAQHVSATHGRRELLVKPDGFVRIHEHDGEGVYEHLFFLEVDRSTETQEIVAQKAGCYLNFYQTGGMAERFGGSKEDFRQFPFRVLMVFRNEERRNNAAERLLQHTPPIQSLVWLCTMEDLVDDPFDSIWLRPKDYLEATQGSQFDPMRRGIQTVYRRQREREQEVRTRAKQQRLLQCR